MNKFFDQIVKIVVNSNVTLMYCFGIDKYTQIANASRLTAVNVKQQSREKCRIKKAYKKNRNWLYESENDSGGISNYTISKELHDCWPQCLSWFYQIVLKWRLQIQILHRVAVMIPLKLWSLCW